MRVGFSDQDNVLLGFNGRKKGLQNRLFGGTKTGPGRDFLAVCPEPWSALQKGVFSGLSYDFKFIL
jgi:hypothetical protein